MITYRNTTIKRQQYDCLARRQLRLTMAGVREVCVVGSHPCPVDTGFRISGQQGFAPVRELNAKAGHEAFRLSRLRLVAHRPDAALPGSFLSCKAYAHETNFAIRSCAHVSSSQPHARSNQALVKARFHRLIEMLGVSFIPCSDHGRCGS